MTELASDFRGGVEGLRFGLCGFVLVGGRLKDRLQIDRHRMIAGGNHVFLVHVGRREAVKQRKPGAGAPEKSLAAVLIGAARVIDEFGPAVAVARDRAHRLQFDRRAGAVQSLDQAVPGDVEPQILRLVDDARAVLEADDRTERPPLCGSERSPSIVATRLVRRRTEGFRGGSPPDRHRGAGRIRARYRSTAA